jgi:hypothetical protein
MNFQKPGRKSRGYGTVCRSEPRSSTSMSFITLVPKWTGFDSAVTLEEFLSSVEAAEGIGRWQDSDTREIAALKLSGSAKTFYQGCTEHHEVDATWQTFKNAFRHRYEDVHTDQFHFTRLQTARQEFADRCMGLAQKVMAKTGDPLPRVYIARTRRGCF